MSVGTSLSDAVRPHLAQISTGITHAQTYASSVGRMLPEGTIKAVIGAYLVVKAYMWIKLNRTTEAPRAPTAPKKKSKWVSLAEQANVEVQVALHPVAVLQVHGG